MAAAGRHLCETDLPRDASFENDMGRHWRTLLVNLKSVNVMRIRLPTKNLNYKITTGLTVVEAQMGRAD